ncbi:UNVERIFIED_CONTAM: Retrovirus-related Pol polyprotein from transposon RE1 [Sesamum radiatum]|uniref:Retrovirus-related Pol polyprotein from transposon RE1 n=1 Tax=Sesamum radiatum TaxID=300843 RepID=A0AAW2V436_SESRA
MDDQDENATEEGRPRQKEHEHQHVELYRESIYHHAHDRYQSSSVFADPESHSKMGLLNDKTKYRRLVGKLIYLAVTRPDISFAIGLVSQFMDKPRSVNWEAAIRILKCIKASPGKGLLFNRHGHVTIESYSDSDYAGSKDDRMPTFGYAPMLEGTL